MYNIIWEINKMKNGHFVLMKLPNRDKYTLLSSCLSLIEVESRLSGLKWKFPHGPFDIYCLYPCSSLFIQSLGIRNYSSELDCPWILVMTRLSLDLELNR